MHGGRGGLKSWGFARMAVLLAASRKLRIACAREYQTSIEESVHATLTAQIELLGLQRYFTIQKWAIFSHTGSKFFFAGIKTDPAKFKSTEAIDILWIEEGESVTEQSWQYVTPTVFRNTKGGEIWCGFNPRLESDPTSQRFLVNPVPDARIVETSWRDNPWLPQRMLDQKDHLARVDPDAYQHVWEGKFRQNSQAQVFANKYVIQAFEPSKDWDGPYFGADWGFSQDPTTLVKLWIHERKLFVEHEAYGIGVETDRIAEALFDRIPGARDHEIRADSARPETVNYVQRHGYPRIRSVEKWAGSVEDGIAFLRQFEQIVIHPRCTNTAQEALLYSYKVDRLNPNLVLPEIVDKHNHMIDAMRYALQPLIRRTGFGFVDFANEELKRMEAERKQQQDDRGDK